MIYIGTDLKAHFAHEEYEATGHWGTLNLLCFAGCRI